MGLLEILPRLKSKTCDWTGAKPCGNKELEDHGYCN
jgi:hypothetical protein